MIDNYSWKEAEHKSKLFHGTRIGYRESSLLTPQLRETFYYARERKPKDLVKRDAEPIRYNQE